MHYRGLIAGVMLAAMLPMMSTAQPETKGKHWAYRGAGNDSCGKYIVATSDSSPGSGKAIQNLDGKMYFDQSNLYAQWVQGFLTGINVTDFSGSKQIEIDYTGVQLWISKWCQENPASSLVEAVSAFARSQKQTLERR
jgi:hypothetical protein